MHKIIYSLFVLIIYQGILLSQDNNDLSDIRNERKKYRMKSLSIFGGITGEIRLKYLKNDDLDGMKRALPDLDNAMEEINSTILPDILSDKEEIWKEYIIIIKNNVMTYKEALENGNYEKIKETASNFRLHCFAIQMLVSPSMERFEDFHILIYYLEKYCLSEDKVEKIKNMIPEILEKKDRLLAAGFRYYGQQDMINSDIIKNFETQKQILSPKIDVLINNINSGDLDKIKNSLYDVHRQYHKCDDAIRQEYLKTK
jgi:hypothetical protein